MNDKQAGTFEDRLVAGFRLRHGLLVLAGLMMLLSWLRLGPSVAPTCRTMAVRSLSSETRAIITGTSRVERGVDPRHLIEPTVNLSSGGLAYLTINPIIRMAIERAPDVKLVVIELDVFLLRGHGFIQDRLYELNLPMRDCPVGFFPRIRYVLESGGPLSAMPRVSVEYFVQSLGPQERPPPGSNGYNPFTFFRDLSDENSDELYGATRYLMLHQENNASSSLDKPNTSALLDLLQWLDARNIRWALVTLPHLPGWIRGRPVEWVSAVESCLQAVRDSYPGETIRFWDASSSLGLSRPHFHDGLHLNALGVEIFNQALNERIAGWLAP